MNKVTIEAVSEVMQRFSIGQSLYTISWNKPELIEYTLSSITIEVSSADYCNITFNLEHSNPSMSTFYSYHYLGEYFFDVKAVAEYKLKKKWSL